MKLLRMLDWGLRVLTAGWPLLTELLALLFWSSKLSMPGTLQAIVGIAALCTLVLCPAGRLATRIAYVAAFVLLAHAAWGLATQAYSESGIQTGTVTNAFFALTWLTYLTLRVKVDCAGAGVAQ